MKPQQEPGIALRTRHDPRVQNAVARAAQRTGVDFDYLWNQARVESSLDPSAKAQTSSASGLYQFIEQSWLGTIRKHGAKHGYAWAADAIVQRGNGHFAVTQPDMRRAILALRYDPDASAVMAGEFASDNADHLRNQIGRNPNATDLYFAHFLGSTGAVRFLNATAANPDASGAAAFPREAATNRSIFYTRSGQARSLRDIYALMERKLGGNSASNMPVGDAGLRLTKTLPGMPEPQLMHAGGIDESRPQFTNPFTAHFTDQAQSFDPLRPNPINARLAYMMVVASLDQA